MLRYLILPILVAIFYQVIFSYFDNNKLTPEQHSISTKAVVDCNDNDNEKCEKMKFVIDEDEVDGDLFLESVSFVLKSMGYERTPMPLKTEENLHYDWDVMWTWLHWLQILPIDVSKLKIHQKVHHFPGIPYLVSKHLLATYSDSKYVPKGFLDQNELKMYAEANPNKRFVEKLSSNKGISLKKFSEIIFNQTSHGDVYFAQEFVENPLLIEGHMFDFGIYVVITSVDPLRVYYYTENIVLRFAKLPYNPTDFTNDETYVVDYDKTYGVHFPAFHDFRNFSLSNFYALNENLKKVGVDPKHILHQIEDAIASVVESKEIYILDALNDLDAPYDAKHNFFDVVRFDFIIDKNADIHITEVNMSPNLAQLDATYVRFKNVYRGLIRNTLNMMGVSSYRKFIKHNDTESFEIFCNDFHISTSPEMCMSEKCRGNCELEECELCINCMSDEIKFDLKLGYLEHMNSGGLQRAYPREVTHLKELSEAEWNKLSESNRIYSKWLIEMCEKNTKFC